MKVSLKLNSVAEDNLEPFIFLTLPPKCWAYRFAGLLCSQSSVFSILLSLDPAACKGRKTEEAELT